MNNLTIGKFIEDLSSELPAPGGGAVAALVASLGGALTSMVYSLTKGKKAYENLSEEEKKAMESFIEKAKGFTEETLIYGKRDEEAFNNLILSYKYPKETEEEKLIRTKRIRECTEKCMMVPLELAEKSLKFYENIVFAVEKGNKNLITDAMISAIMIHGAVESSIINVKINLASIKDVELKKSISEKIKDIELESMEMKEKVLSFGYKNIL